METQSCPPVDAIAQGDAPARAPAPIPEPPATPPWVVKEAPPFARLDPSSEYQLEVWRTTGAGTFVLAPGTSVASPVLAIGTEHVLDLAVESADGGRIALEWRDGAAEGDDWRQLATAELDAADGRGSVRARVDLSTFAGRSCAFRVSADAETAGGCTVTTFRICAAHRAGQVNALRDYDRRLAVEVQNFSGNVYDHAIYGERDLDATSPFEVVEFHGSARVPPQEREAAMREAVMRHLSRIEPHEGEIAYTYAQRTLTALLPTTPPNFFVRARELSARRPLKILSLCAGAARVEEQLLAHCNGPVEITLMDANRGLIEQAGARLAGARDGVTVKLALGDVNDGLAGDEAYDVIVCVSALHHVANLERVLGDINAALAVDGEFWSIGEQVGRNGNRLWPDALEAANRAFRALPERLRRNAHTGNVDAAISDADYSAACFEGIRSEELEELLERYLVPVDLYKRSAFLWRLVDATYSGNFDMASQEDLAALRGLVADECVHWMHGGRSTELHGVYRKKYLRIEA